MENIKKLICTTFSVYRVHSSFSKFYDKALVFLVSNLTWPN